MINIGDTRIVNIFPGNPGIKRQATCIAIYKKEFFNMYLFETERGVRTCIVE